MKLGAKLLAGAVAVATLHVGSCALPVGGLGQEPNNTGATGSGLSDAGGSGGTVSTTSGVGGEAIGGAGGGAIAGAGGSAGTGNVGGGTAGGSAGGAGGALGCGADESCVPVLAGGDYVYFVAGSGASCPAGWQQPTAWVAPVDPGCEPCSCGVPSGGSCTPSGVQGYSDDGCGDYAGTVTAGANQQCYDHSGTVSSIRLAASSASGGSCSPNVPSSVPLDVGTVCSMAAETPSGCGANHICVPTPGTSGALCALLAANAVCPANLPVSSSVATIGSDDRSCGCACDTPTGGACAGAQVTMYTDGQCTTVAATVPADGQCHDIPTTSGSLARDYGTWTATSCTPQPSISGEVLFGAPLTLCCPAAS